MCTSISWLGKHHFFGRNLDLEYSYKECIAVTPRNFPFNFRKKDTVTAHFAMIGTATVVGGYPLYYEATNEMGLSMAGLNFPKNATYLPERDDKDNITPFELIPWILGQCADVAQARSLFEKLNVVNIPFSEQFPLSPLHWIVADRHSCIVVEPMTDGIHIWDDPIGVLTNNPPFDYHLHNLSNYMGLSASQAENRFCPTANLKPYSNGMGATGLPGDFSSASRFVKAAFVKLNSVGGETVHGDVMQFFHILRSVEMPRGSVVMPDGRFEITLYSSCCDTDTGIYYYTTYENGQICAVDMHKENLESQEVITFPMLSAPAIIQQN